MSSRINIDVVRNLESREVRVIISIPLSYAQDLSADLKRASICSGTHALSAALAAALRDSSGDQHA